MVSKNYLALPESDIIIDYIEKRYKKGLYTLSLIYGLPGTGKSSVCIRLAQKTSKQLHGEDRIGPERIISSLLEFVEFVRKAKPGDVCVIEEISVLFPSRRAMSSDNVAIAGVLDTCRKKQIIIFSNAPILNSIDKHMRCMAHISIETLKIVKSQEVVVCKPLRMQTNPSSGKTYLHRFQRKGRDVHRCYTKMPEGDIWEKYEGMKDKFLNELYDRLKAKAQIKLNKEMKELGKKVKVVQQKPLTEKELKVYELYNNQGMTMQKIADLEGCSKQNIDRILKNVDKKLVILHKNSDVNVENSNSPAINLNNNSPSEINQLNQEDGPIINGV